MQQVLGAPLHNDGGDWHSQLVGLDVDGAADHRLPDLPLVPPVFGDGYRGHLPAELVLEVLCGAGDQGGGGEGEGGLVQGVSWMWFPGRSVVSGYMVVNTLELERKGNRSIEE